ncbi:hypothetical protein MBLNU457_3229t1 [Dothideomycetes sp. NU457]
MSISITTQKHSSSTDGFFQELPELPPIFTSPDHLATSSSGKNVSMQSLSDDTAFARILALYLPKDESEPIRTIHDMSRTALKPEVLIHAVDAEVNRPTLRPYNTFGRENKNDPLWTTAGWKALKRIYQEEGLISVAYDKKVKTWNRRVQQFALNHAFICTGTMTGCPMSMTDGAAKLLENHLDAPDGDQPGLNRIVHEVYRRLTSSDPQEAWTCGQWMTERTGGSDVSGTETLAVRLDEQQLEEERKSGREMDVHGMPLGPWQIHGFKWFSSATDSDMAMLLARTENGLSLFYAPMRRSLGGRVSSAHAPASELNGVRIQRLKDKIGTKSLPTAELELSGMRAYLIGQEGKGVKEISAILNMTRLYTAAGGSGYWARGMQICRAHSKVRKIRGGLLQDNQLHLRWMAGETVKYTAATHFAFFGVALYGALEQDPEVMVRPTKAAGLIPNDKTVLASLLRLLTPVMKSQITKGSVAGLRETMECLGGVGYCENNEDGGVYSIAKVFRDSLAGPIWEGTASVMAEDIVRVLTDKRIGNGQVIDTVLAPWTRHVIDGCRGQFPEERSLVLERLDVLLAIIKPASKEELLFRGRELLTHLEYIACSVLLMYDACTDSDEVAIEIARRWARSEPAGRSGAGRSSWLEDSVMNRRIFLGDQAGSAPITAKL